MERLLLLWLYMVLWITMHGVRGYNRSESETKIEQSEVQKFECLQQLELFSQTCNEQQMAISGEFNATEQTVAPCCWDTGCCTRLNHILTCLEDCTLFDDQHTAIIKLIARFGSVCELSLPLPSCITQSQYQKFNVTDPCSSISQQLQQVCSKESVQISLQYSVRPQDGFSQQCCWPSSCCSLAKQFNQYQCMLQNQIDVLPFAIEEKSSALQLNQQSTPQEIFKYNSFYVTGIAELWSEICGLKKSSLLETELGVNSNDLYSIKISPKISAANNATNNNFTESDNDAFFVSQNEQFENGGSNIDDLKLAILQAYNMDHNENNNDYTNNLKNNIEVSSQPHIENTYVQNFDFVPVKESDFNQFNMMDLYISEAGLDCGHGDSACQFGEDQLQLYYSVGHAFCLVKTFADLNNILEADKDICCNNTYKVLLGICQFFRCSQKPSQPLDEESVLSLQFWSVACMHDVQECDILQATEYAKIGSISSSALPISPATIVLPQIPFSKQQTALSVPPLMDSQQARNMKVFDALKQIPSLSTVNIAFKSIQQQSQLPSERPITIFAPSNKGIESLTHSSSSSTLSSHQSKILDLIGSEHWNRDLLNHITLQKIEFQNITVGGEYKVETYCKENLTLKRFSEAGDLYVVGCCKPDNYAKIIAGSQFQDGAILMLDKLLYSQNGIFGKLQDDFK